MKVDLSTTQLESDRLLLRPFQASDLEDFNAYTSIPGLGEMAGWPHHKSLEETKFVLDLFIKEKNNFAIVLKEEDKMIGSLGFHQAWTADDRTYEDLHALEIGYVLAKGYWGRGLVVEAAKLVIQFAFDEYDLDAITCSHFKGNNQSRRVIEKLGFRFVKKGTYHAKQLGTHEEDLRYILMREDWKE